MSSGTTTMRYHQSRVRVHAEGVRPNESVVAVTPTTDINAPLYLGGPLPPRIDFSIQDIGIDEFSIVAISQWGREVRVTEEIDLRWRVVR